MDSAQRNIFDDQTCEAVHSLIPAYSVGATDPEETRLVEAHLETCPEAAAELKAYRALAATLLHSAPPMQAPPHLHDQLMREAQRRAAVGTSEPAPRLPGLINRRRAIDQPSLWAVVALCGLLLLSNLYWFAQISKLQNAQAQTRALLEGHNAVLALIGAGNVQRIELAGVQNQSSHAMLLCSPDEEAAFLYAEDMPALLSGEVYQVWLLREDGQRVQAGAFSVDGEGDGTLVFQAPDVMGHFEAVEITREGSQPSSLVVQGRLYD
jgi:hypothetical protein